MPETRLEAVRWWAKERKASTDAAKADTGSLHVAMRVARADGASLAKLADASGLSVAQVQRICDLSKDRSE